MSLAWAKIPPHVRRRGWFDPENLSRERAEGLRDWLLSRQELKPLRFASHVTPRTGVIAKLFAAGLVPGVPEGLTHEDVIVAFRLAGLKICACAGCQQVASYGTNIKSAFITRLLWGEQPDEGRLTHRYPLDSEFYKRKAERDARMMRVRAFAASHPRQKKT